MGTSVRQRGVRFRGTSAPPRVEYELTELGRTLRAPLDELGRWADEHVERALAARETYDARLGPLGAVAPRP
jgi:DNA-binding HxlR family transcriptional regulator